MTLINGVKEDKVLDKLEFDTVEEALNYVNSNFSNMYDYKLKLEKEGIQYKSNNLDIWVENIKDIGYSIEFSSKNENEIEKAINMFNIKERLNISIPEYLYNMLEK